MGNCITKRQKFKQSSTTTDKPTMIQRSESRSRIKKTKSDLKNKKKHSFKSLKSSTRKTIHTNSRKEPRVITAQKHSNLPGYLTQPLQIHHPCAKVSDMKPKQPQSHDMPKIATEEVKDQQSKVSSSKKALPTTTTIGDINPDRPSKLSGDWHHFSSTILT